jgi:hypothetical protein
LPISYHHPGKIKPVEKSPGSYPGAFLHKPLFLNILAINSFILNSLAHQKSVNATNKSSLLKITGGKGG